MGTIFVISLPIDIRIKDMLGSIASFRTFMAEDGSILGIIDKGIAANDKAAWQSIDQNTKGSRPDLGEDPGIDSIAHEILLWNTGSDQCQA